MNQETYGKDASAKKRSLDKEECFFGSKCYRKNPHHFREYQHAKLLDVLVTWGEKPPPEELKGFEIDKAVVLEQLVVMKDVCKDEVERRRGVKKTKVDTGVEKELCVSPKSKEKIITSSKKSVIQAKLEYGMPLGFFLTKIKDSPETHNDQLSIYFADLLHPSLGELKASLQINFMVEWDWLKMNYEITKNEEKPLLIIYGDPNPDLAPSNLPKNVRAIMVKPRFPFGKHHTKMMVLEYSDESVRIVVSTANLIGSDWENRTQGLWVSPKCPKLTEDGKSGDSVTGFKASLLRYLRYYEVTPLKHYIELVKACDFSSVKVFFVSSVPNSHKGQDINLWGHRQVGNILRRHIPATVDSWPLIFQCSSIGSLGATDKAWLKDDLARSFSTTKANLRGDRIPEVSVVYPSKLDVYRSYDGVFGGGCLPYSRKTHEKQLWLENHLHRWVAASTNRMRAMPHIKTYTKIDPENRKAAYFLLTSANLSKAAWGMSNKNKDSLQIQSYEAGILFLPQVLTGEDYFELGNDLRLPFDIPLTRYTKEDSCWFMDYLREAMAE